MALLLLTSTAKALTCEEWDWHKDYVSSFYCITYNGETYMSDVRVPPNGSTPPNSDLWERCVIVGNSCLTDSALVANQCKTSDTIHVSVYDTTKIPVNVYDTVTSVIRDTLRAQINLFDTTTAEIIKLDTVVQTVIKLDTTIFEVSIYDTVNVVTTKFDTIYSQVAKIDTIHNKYNLYDTIYNTIYDTLITAVDLVDSIYQTDTIVKFVTMEFNVLDSVYINNKYFSISNITKSDLTKTPLLITTIDTSVIPITELDTVVLHYNIILYDNFGQFINSVKGTDTLALFGSVRHSEIPLLPHDKHGYLISNAGRRLANGIIIIKGVGSLTVNGTIKSTYNYSDVEGYMRK